MNPQPNPNDAPPQRQGVVAVCIVDAAFLVIRRSQHVEAPGAYCFPGGAIESGEDESTALKREMREELNCEVQTIRRLWRSRTDWGVELAWWLIRVDDNATLSPNPHEVDSIHWMQEEEMLQTPQLLSSNLAFLDAWREGEFELH